MINVYILMTTAASVAIGTLVAYIFPFWVTGVLFGLGAVGFWYFLDYFQQKLENVQKALDIAMKDAEDWEVEDD